MIPSYLEVEKTGSQLFLVSQTLLQLFEERILKNGLLLFGDQKISSQLLGARKKIMISI